MGIIDFLGRVVTLKSSSKEVTESPTVVVERLQTMINQLIADLDVSHEKIKGICVGLPGLINNKTGRISVSTQLGWNDLDFAELVEQTIGYSTYIDNELKLKAYSEKLFGKAKNSQKMVMIGFGSGVGSALMIGDNIYRGHSNSAGEIGHSIVDPNGALCTCGNLVVCRHI